MADQKQPQSQRHRAFRIFILMASRRLSSDVQLRQYPELRPAMRGVTSAFRQWVAGSS